jgi:hypothetical protein
MSTIQKLYPPAYKELHDLIRAIQHERSVNFDAAALFPPGETRGEDVRKYVRSVNQRVYESATTGPALAASTPETGSHKLSDAWSAVPLAHLAFLGGLLAAADAGERAESVDLEYNVEVCSLAGADLWHKNCPSELSDSESLIEHLERATQVSQQNPAFSLM